MHRQSSPEKRIRDESYDDSVQLLFAKDNAEWTLEYLLLGDLADLLSEGYDEETHEGVLFGTGDCPECGMG